MAAARILYIRVFEPSIVRDAQDHWHVVLYDSPRVACVYSSVSVSCLCSHYYVQKGYTYSVTYGGGTAAAVL